MRNKKLTRFLTILFFLYVLIAETSCSGKGYSRQETIDNFKKREKEILTLADYFTTLKPNCNEIFFEPEGNRYTISIAPADWAILPEHPYKAGSNMKINSVEMASFLKTLDWTTKTILTLKDMLNKANCKSISTHDDYLQLDFGSGDVCSFWYIISQEPFPDSVIEQHTKAGVTVLTKNVRIGSSCSL